MAKEKLLLLSGAGASKSFGYFSTKEFTTKIENSIKYPSRRVSVSALSLYQKILFNLENYLINPPIVTFEDIYQGIQDVKTLLDIPTGASAFNEFRPRVGATHELKKDFSSFTIADALELQGEYIDSLLATFLDSLKSIGSTVTLESALNRLEHEYTIWSMTLNYDNILDEKLVGYETGFISGIAPRRFDPEILPSALLYEKAVHIHLHGSLKWGFPKSGTTDPFAIHEYDNPKDGVENSSSRPSGRPIQRGETLPPSPVMTGLDKAEMVFREPYFTNFMTFFRSLSSCNSILIAGYGFSDYHLNIGIRQCRMNKPDVRTYIIDTAASAHPEYYISQISPIVWDTILPEDEGIAGRIPEIIPGHPGWWRVPGNTKYKTSPIFLWPNDFKAFCDDTSKNGLPR